MPGGWGVFTTSEVGRNLTAGVPGVPRDWLRLESFTRNIPERNLTLRLGDSATRRACGAATSTSAASSWAPTSR